MRLLVLAASPRPDGNSRLMAGALVEGAREVGVDAGIVDLNVVMSGGFLRDCRACRRPDGRCSIDDGYEELLTCDVAGADALVYATPLYWYGMAAVLKNFFDRMVCYVSASYPRSEEVAGALAGKRIALLVSSEETYPGALVGVVDQLQEMSRYLRQDFAAVVRGIGNRRGEVAADPGDPLRAARQLGRDLLSRHHSDYRIDSERPNGVWEVAQTVGRGAWEDV